MKNLLFGLIIGLLLCFIGMKIFEKKPAQDATVIEHIDTVRDTVKIPKPYPVKVYLTGETIHDTLPGTHDSIPVEVDIPISRSVYQDSNYRAVVSGYKPKLDSIEVYGKTITKTRWYPKMYNPKWSLGFQIGYGAGKNGLTPFVGIGIQYNLFSW